MCSLEFDAAAAGPSEKLRCWVYSSSLRCLKEGLRRVAASLFLIRKDGTLLLGCGLQWNDKDLGLREFFHGHCVGLYLFI